MFMSSPIVKMAIRDYKFDKIDFCKLKESEKNLYFLLWTELPSNQRITHLTIFCQINLFEIFS